MKKENQQPINVTKTFLPPIKEYINKLEEIWDSNWLTNNGKMHWEFEEHLKKYLSVNNLSLLVNGHLALESAIKVLGLKGEVITTPFTFASTTHAIVNQGLRPVFCDIDKHNLNIDYKKIESLINEKTSAIMPVHVFGTPCNVTEIKRIADKYNLKVVYDAAHAFGVKINGTSIGDFGDVSMFSLHATKVFHSIEGGILTYAEEKYKSKVDLYKNFGIRSPEVVEAPGINAKMNEFQAAMGLINLKYIDDEIRKRRFINKRYKSRLSKFKGVTYLQEIDGVDHNYSYFPIIINERECGLSRDEMHERLKGYNIFTRKYFYPLSTQFDCYEQYEDKEKLKNAYYIADRVLTLPMYSSLEFETVDYICECIEKVLNAK